MKYIILGIFIIIVIESILMKKETFEKSKQIRPTIDNYKDITYIDDNGIYYKYKLVKLE